MKEVVGRPKQRDLLLSLNISTNVEAGRQPTLPLTKEPVHGFSRRASDREACLRVATVPTHKVYRVEQQVEALLLRLQPSDEHEVRPCIHAVGPPILKPRLVYAITQNQRAAVRLNILELVRRQEPYLSSASEHGARNAVKVDRFQGPLYGATAPTTESMSGRGIGKEAVRKLNPRNPKQDCQEFHRCLRWDQSADDRHTEVVTVSKSSNQCPIEVGAIINPEPLLWFRRATAQDIDRPPER